MPLRSLIPSSSEAPPALERRSRYLIILNLNCADLPSETGSTDLELQQPL